MAKKKTEKKGKNLAEAAKYLLGMEKGMLRDVVDIGEGIGGFAKDLTGGKRAKGAAGMDPSGPQKAMTDKYGIPPAEFMRMMGYKEMGPAVKITVSGGEMEPTHEPLHAEKGEDVSKTKSRAPKR